MTAYMDDMPPGDWFCPSCGSKIDDAKISQENYDGRCDTEEHGHPDPHVYGDTVTFLSCVACKFRSRIYDRKGRWW